MFKHTETIVPLATKLEFTPLTFMVDEIPVKSLSGIVKGGSILLNVRG